MQKATMTKSIQLKRKNQTLNKSQHFIQFTQEKFPFRLIHIMQNRYLINVNRNNKNNKRKKNI